MTSEGTSEERTDSKHSLSIRQDSSLELSQILSVISHEIKNPLASLTLNGQMITRAIERGQAPRIESARLLSAAVSQLNQLASELSEAARIDSARPALTLQPTDLVALARARVDAAEATNQRSIATDLPGKPALARIDANAISQALGYLLDNAARFTPAPRAIALSLRRTDGQARLEVRDEGPGIAPDDLARVFEPFYRGQTPTQPNARNGAGLGLGLYIARRIIQVHRGDIGVTSAPGHGATFWITLPLTSPDS